MFDRVALMQPAERPETLQLEHLLVGKYLQITSAIRIREGRVKTVSLDKEKAADEVADSARLVVEPNFSGAAGRMLPEK